MRSLGWTTQRAAGAEPPSTMREFIDLNGSRWVVWEVHPMLAERRHGAPDTRPHPRVERRAHDRPRAQVRAEYSDGWLVFECATERRRVAPIPHEWEALAEHALAELCERGERAPRSRRLIE